YGVAWHQPMAESIAWARTTLAEALPSPARLTGGFAANAGRIGILPLPGSAAPDARSNVPAPATTEPTAAAAPANTASLDPDITTLMDDRRARLAVLRVEGPRMLNAGDWRRAGE